MGRVSHERDSLAAAQGYLRTIYVARLTGVQRNAVFTWPVQYVDIANARFYLWDAVLQHMGAQAVQVLGLPATAQEALNRAVSMSKNAKVSPIAPDLMCLDPSPYDANVRCQKGLGHNGKHKPLGDGPEWGSPANEKRYQSFKAAGGHKGQGKDPHPVVEKLGKDGPELQAHLYGIEPDVPAADFGGVPADHPLSKYLGNPLKRTDEQIDALVIYNNRVPSYDVIKKRKWKCDRAASGAPLRDWWLGEYILGDDQTLAVRWSKLLTLSTKKAAAVPPPQEGPTEASTTSAAQFEPSVAQPVPGTPPPSPMLAMGMTAPPVAPAPPPLPPSRFPKEQVVAAAKALTPANVPGPDGTHVPPPAAPTPPPLPDPATVATPPLPSLIPTTKPLAPAPPPVPKLPTTMLCRVPTCGHDITFHGPSGCAYKAGTPHACDCKQVPAPEYLDRLKQLNK